MTTRYAVPLALLAVLGITTARAEVRKVTIRAPFDGFVESVALPGTEYPGETPRALYDFNRLRKDTGTAAHPLKVRTLPLEPAVDVTPNTVAMLTSEVLDLQLAEETRKLEAAQARLDAAQSSFTLEKDLKSHVVEARKAQDEAGRYFAEHNRNVFHSDGGLSQSDANTYASNAGTDRTETRQVFDQRLDYQLSKDFPDRLKIAQKELKAARNSVEIINATLKLGEIVCPRHCRVKAVYVFSEQWVTKGDPLLDVEIDQ
jgi:hypothetical protein